VVAGLSGFATCGAIRRPCLTPETRDQKRARRPARALVRTSLRVA
jgi:hypothetical protein